MATTIPDEQTLQVAPVAVVPAHAAAGQDPLVEGFRAGDAAAFSQVIDGHHVAVFRTVRRLLGWGRDAGEVEDVVQEVFLAALRQRQRFRGDSGLGTWLVAIAVRRCRSYQRGRWLRRMRFRERREDVAVEGVLSDDTGEAVRAAVAGLPTKEREVVVMYYLEQMSSAETARVLGISTGAVDVRLHRARQKLKARLAEFG